LCDGATSPSGWRLAAAIFVRHFYLARRTAMALVGVCETAMQSPGVLGVVCVDSNGLCLASQGEVPPATSGAIAELAAKASVLCEDGAVICITGASSKIMVSRADGVTTAIFMDPAAVA